MSKAPKYYVERLVKNGMVRMELLDANGVGVELPNFGRVELLANRDTGRYGDPNTVKLYGEGRIMFTPEASNSITLIPEPGHKSWVEPHPNIEAHLEIREQLRQMRDAVVFANAATFAKAKDRDAFLEKLRTNIDSISAVLGND